MQQPVKSSRNKIALVLLTIASFSIAQNCFSQRRIRYRNKMELETISLLSVKNKTHSENGLSELSNINAHSYNLVYGINAGHSGFVEFGVGVGRLVSNKRLEGIARVTGNYGALTVNSQANYLFLPLSYTFHTSPSYRGKNEGSSNSRLFSTLKLSLIASVLGKVSSTSLKEGGADNSSAFSAAEKIEFRKYNFSLIASAGTGYLVSRIYWITFRPFLGVSTNYFQQGAPFEHSNFIVGASFSFVKIGAPRIAFERMDQEDEEEDEEDTSDEEETIGTIKTHSF